MGPPCPRCGWTLTWYAQSSTWGCDRERMTFTPQQIQQPPIATPAATNPAAPLPYPVPPQQPPWQAPPQPQAQPQLQQIPKTVPINTFQQQNQGYPQAGPGFGQQLPPPAMPPPARKAAGSNKTLLLAAGGVVVVAGIAIAVVATRGGSSSSAIGVDSRDKLVRLTFKSLTDGDVDGVVKRSGMPGMKKYLTCDKDEAPSAEAEAGDLQEFRDSVASSVARLKGATITVTKITPDTKPEVMAKGSDLGRGCKLNAPLEVHDVKVDIDIEHANGGSLEKQTAEISVAMIDGRWFTQGMPRISGCTGAVEQIAHTSVSELRVPDAVNSLQPVLMSHCVKDEWSPTVVKCLEGAPNMAEVRKCIGALTPKELAPLTKDVEAALASATGAGKELRTLIPDPAEIQKPAVAANDTTQPAKPADPDAALVDDTLVPEVAPPDPNDADPGTPEQAEQADFWLWTRGDNAVRVTSPVVKATFPGRPEQLLKKGSGKTLDGKDIWLYQFVYDLGDDGQLRLEISSLGRNAGHGDRDPLVAMMAKIGKVKRKKQEINGVWVTDYEVTEASTGGTLRTHAIRDLKRGLMIIAIAATSPKTRAAGTKFLSSVSEVMGPDPVEDPATLTVSAKKAGKKYIASTSTGDFTMELPTEPKLTQTPPSAGKSFVGASLLSELKKKGSINVQITEHASWDALTFHPTRQEEIAEEMKAELEKQTGTAMKLTPGRLAGVTGFAVDQVAKEKPKVQFRMLWNRYQHRTFMIFCVDTDCDGVVKTIKFEPPAAE